MAATVDTGPAGLEGRRETLWRNGDFLKFWIGETLSLYGTQVTVLALPLTAVLVFGVTPEQLGLLRFVQFVPYVVFGMLFGVLVDRRKRRSLMLLSNAVRMTLVGLIPTLAAVDHLRLDLLYAITFGIGVASVLFDVSWMSYIPHLVRESRYLVEANSKLGATSASAEAAGPGIAGALVAMLTAPIAMAVDAGSYVISMLSLWLIKAPETAPSRQERHLVAELRSGLSWVFGNVYLRALALAGSACNFFVMATSTMFIIYAVRQCGVRPSMLGVILSMAAVGGLAGSLVAGRIVRRFPLGRVYCCSLAIIFLGPLLIPAASGPTLVVEAMFVGCFLLVYAGLSVSNLVVITLRQTITPPQLMGRMNAAMRTLMWGAGSLGGPVAGLLGDISGVRTGLWITGLASTAMLVPVLLSPVSRLREMPSARPTAGS